MILILVNHIFIQLAFFLCMNAKGAVLDADFFEDKYIYQYSQEKMVEIRREMVFSIFCFYFWVFMYICIYIASSVFITATKGNTLQRRIKTWR